MKLAVMLMAVMKESATEAAAPGPIEVACPDLAPIRTRRVSDSFQPQLMVGLWYEQAYMDVAQLGASCQTLKGRFNSSTQLLSMDFSVRYGPLPFTIVEDYKPFDERGLYVKRAEMPGAGLLTLPTVIVDAVPSQDGSTFSGQHQRLSVFHSHWFSGSLVL